MATEPTLIKPRDLPEAADVYADDAMVVDNGVTVGRGTPVQVVNAGAPVASQSEAIAGVDNAKRMTALRVKQAIANANVATNIRQVADTTALSALDASVWKAAITADGENYIFDESDLSAEITASDPRYVAPASDPTGASGAWVKTAVRSMMANADELGVVTGTVSDAVALTNAQKINAWLAAGDCFIFDWRADEIGIAETIRLGNDGNGIIGVPAHGIFGASASGSRMKWQGEAGGTMVLLRSASNSADLLSPTFCGIELDGNDLAAYPLRIEGVQRGLVERVNIRNFRSSTVGDFGLTVRNNQSGSVSGAQVNCAYGVKFSQVSITANGNAGGVYLSGTSGTSGQNTTFCLFDHIHVVYSNGDAMVIDDADDVIIDVLGTSRNAGGTGRGLVLSSTTGPATRIVTGNVIHNANFSKADGAAVPVVFDGANVMGNSITINGVDGAPDLQFVNGATRDMNPGLRFLGQPNYSGGWTADPWMIAQFPNEDIANQRVLDHYLENTSAVPGIAFGGASVGVTYGSRSMRSVRIGGVVIVSGSLTLTDKGSSTGAATITGLPVNASIAGAVSIGYYADLAGAVSSPPMGAANASGVIALRKAGDATAANMTDADFTNSTRIDFSVTYVVA